jgi:hypothetical protein
MLMKKTLNLRPCFVLLTTALLSCAAFTLNAQTYVSSEATVYDDDVTPLGQGNNAIVNAKGQDVADNACVPTASANGLSFLEAYQTEVLGNPNPFSTSPNTYNAVNTLIGNMGTTAKGTPTVGQMNGMYNYLQANAPSVSLFGQVAPVEKANLPGFYGAGAFNAGFAANVQAANPSASFLYNALNAKDAVELGLLWGTYTPGANNGPGTFNYTGGHEVTLEGMRMSGGTGTLSVLDPWGTTQQPGNHAGSSGTLDIPLSVTTVSLAGIAGTFLDVTYSTVLVGEPNETSGNLEFPNPAENVGFAATGDKQALIIDDAVESAPEQPATMALLGASVLALLVMRRNVRKIIALY